MEGWSIEQPGPKIVVRTRYQPFSCEERTNNILGLLAVIVQVCGMECKDISSAAIYQIQADRYDIIPSLSDFKVPKHSNPNGIDRCIRFIRNTQRQLTYRVGCLPSKTRLRHRKRHSPTKIVYCHSLK
jgi:hypothetical protein